MFFLNLDFNFAHLEIEESFGLILLNLQNGRFHLRFSFWVFKGARFRYGFFVHFVHKRSFGQIWVKITE